MKAVFLSDAHLKNSSDERYEKLISFFDDLKEGRLRSLIDRGGEKHEAVHVDDLFVAGDFFDFWFCRKDSIYPAFKSIIEKLKELQRAGIRIHLFEGNHDFFMKEYFGDALGMEVFGEWAELEIDDKKFLIGHGDTADQTNAVYILLRKVLRSRAFYQFQRFIPQAILWRIADLSSAASRELNKDNANALFEKMSSFALRRLRQGHDVVILGHSHQAIVQNYKIDGKNKTFVALGDWIKHYSFVYYEDGEFILSHYHSRNHKKNNQNWT